MLRQQLDRQGHTLVPAILSAAEAQRLSGLIDAPAGKPGQRERLVEGWCADLALGLRHHQALAPALAPDAVALQCICFEKSADLNGLVAVHQDLGFPVKGHTAHPAWKAWSVKDGTTYVQPPLPVLEQLLAVRVHLDPCGLNDGPLVVVPGSHRQGVVAPDEAIALRAEEELCPAALGDALLMRPLLLHRSSKARGQSRRRVLHFVFGPRQLPDGIAWLHAI
ncbi:phytanoyl-CoA dioxygenase family protein [Hydrogenophaga sp. RWCD_12]|uniref:phytanoyl-CoA dioxygenase family protein n=1 Tax=Hydrogenophaga sp. RWCD_12 TaxID=3391190 RepID=UPI0039847254